MNKKIIISIFIFFIILLLSISIIMAINTNNEDTNMNKEKIYFEIRYIDSEIINMSNLLNINSDCQELQKSIQRLYSYWNSAILDLNNLDIEKNYLTDFGKILDNLTISIKKQDRQVSLNNLIELYNRLIIYNKSLNYDANYNNILLAKYNLLSAYSISEQGNWTIMHENIIECGNYLSNAVNSMENNQYNQYNINQAYIAVKELENLINVKDLDLFYFKYQIAINKLKNI